MYYVLHNPKSNKGLSRLDVSALVKKLKKKYEVTKVNVIRIIGEEKQFIANLTENDAIVICGGDGTINRFVNGILGCEIVFKIFVFPSGSGNDFAREFKKHKLFEVTDVFKNLPKIRVNDEYDATFVNGIGMGFDAMVCAKKEEYAKNKVKKSYGKIALESLNDFVPYSLDIEVDGKDIHFDNVLLFVINHGKYFGGGMKVAPKASRYDDKLDLCIIHGLNKFKFLILFLTIFFGGHIAFKKYVYYLQGKKFTIKKIGFDYMQADGELHHDVKTLTIEA